MSAGSKGTGAGYLAHKSELAKSRKDLPAYKDILIVEDEALASDRLVATLRGLLGQDLEVRRARTVNTAIDMMLQKLPDLIMLDDYVGPHDTALDSLPLIRHTKFAGPVIVVSGRMSRHRRAELLSKGADETINKDDLDSGTISEALLRLISAGKATAQG
jgi:CheY-like chemotaxis protein